MAAAFPSLEVNEAPARYLVGEGEDAREIVLPPHAEAMAALAAFVAPAELTPGWLQQVLLSAAGLDKGDNEKRKHVYLNAPVRCEGAASPGSTQHGPHQSPGGTPSSPAHTSW